MAPGTGIFAGQPQYTRHSTSGKQIVNAERSSSNALDSPLRRLALSSRLDRAHVSHTNGHLRERHEKEHNVTQAAQNATQQSNQASSPSLLERPNTHAHTGTHNTTTNRPAILPQECEERGKNTRRLPIKSESASPACEKPTPQQCPVALSTRWTHARLRP